MLFPTIEFAAFFTAVFALSWWLMPRHLLWKPFILVASYVFYGSADARFVLLLAGSTVFNQAMAELVHRIRPGRRRASALAVAVSGNLLLLGWFKYYGFFVATVAGGLDRLGLHAPLPLLQVALPAGISFFTFQAVSYVVDVHRGVIRPAKPIDFAVYLAFFPHLVAGPIVRATEFIPQLARPRDARSVQATRAFFLIAGGLVKKVLIADVLAAQLVDPVFAIPGQHSGLEVLLAVYGYAVQIFCDFSAYSDMAIGLALLLGFRFPENFAAPYTAVSLRDFWRRWHITLSRWLRDYLYVPLGGNRGGPRRAARNLMLTMLLGGLWHGAAWNFVVWGGIHGAGLVLERRLAGRRTDAPDTVWRRVRGRLVTFHVVCLAWVFFRADGVGAALRLLGRLVTGGAGAGLVTPTVLLAMAVGLGVQYLPRDAWRRVQSAFAGFAPAAQAAALAAVLVLVDAVGRQGVAPFIYFRF